MSRSQDPIDNTPDKNATKPNEATDKTVTPVQDNSLPIDSEKEEAAQYIKVFNYEMSVMQYLSEGTNPETKDTAAEMTGAHSITEAAGMISWINAYQAENKHRNPDLEFLKQELSYAYNYQKKLYDLVDLNINDISAREKIANEYADQVIHNLRKNGQAVILGSQLIGEEGHRIYKRYKKLPNGAYESRISNAGGDSFSDNLNVNDITDKKILEKHRDVNIHTLYPTTIYNEGTQEDVEKQIRKDIVESLKNSYLGRGMIQKYFKPYNLVDESKFKGVGHHDVASGQTAQNCPFRSFLECANDIANDHIDVKAQKDSKESLGDFLHYLYKTPFSQVVKNFDIKPEELLTPKNAQDNSLRTQEGFTPVTRKIAIIGISAKFAKDNSINPEIVRGLYYDLVGTSKDKKATYDDLDLPVTAEMMKEPNKLLKELIKSNKGLTAENKDLILEQWKRQIILSPDVTPDLKASVIYYDDQLKEEFGIENNISAYKLKQKLRNNTIQSEIGEEILHKNPNAQGSFESRNNISNVQSLQDEAKHSIGADHLQKQQKIAKEHLEKRLGQIRQKFDKTRDIESSNPENIDELNNRVRNQDNPKVERVTLPNGSKIPAAKYAEIIMNIEAKEKYSNDVRKQTNYMIERKIRLEDNFKGDVLQMYPLEKYGKKIQQELKKTEDEIIRESPVKQSFVGGIKKKFTDIIDTILSDVPLKYGMSRIFKIITRPLKDNSTAARVEPIKPIVKKQNKQPDRHYQRSKKPSNNKDNSIISR